MVAFQTGAAFLDIVEDTFQEVIEKDRAAIQKNEVLREYR